jgi:hypothetical protein
LVRFLYAKRGGDQALKWGFQYYWLIGNEPPQ